MAMVRPAEPADAAAIIALLALDGLQTRGVLEPGSRYWVAEVSGEIVGAIGLELGRAGSALLRSAIVHAHARGQRIGEQLTAAAFDWARARGHPRVYCYSTDAGRYWIRLGFVEVPVAEVLGALGDAPQSVHFAELGWLPQEVAYRRDLSTESAASATQQVVARMVREQGLTADPAHRVLDLMAEVGELSKALLESSRYGAQPFSATPGWREELGDAYFALLCLADQTNISLDSALSEVLIKYRERLAARGSPGSG